MDDEKISEQAALNLPHDVYGRLLAMAAERGITPIRWLENELAQFEQTKVDRLKPKDDRK